MGKIASKLLFREWTPPAESVLREADAWFAPEHPANHRRSRTVMRGKSAVHCAEFGWYHGR